MLMNLFFYLVSVSTHLDPDQIFFSGSRRPKKTNTGFRSTTLLTILHELLKNADSNVFVTSSPEIMLNPGWFG